MANERMHLIPVPSGLSAYLLLIPLRGQEECRKQAGIGDAGRSDNKDRISCGGLRVPHLAP